MNTKRKLIALILSVLMLVACSVTAFAKASIGDGGTIDLSPIDISSAEDNLRSDVAERGDLTTVSLPARSGGLFSLFSDITGASQS